MPPRRRSFKRRRSYKSRRSPALRRYKAVRRVAYRRRRTVQRRRGRTTVRNIRSLEWFPDRVRVKLRTFTEHNTVAAASELFIMPGNSFAFQGPGAGNPWRVPANFGLYQNIYKRYLIHGSSVTYRFRSANTSTTTVETLEQKQFETNAGNTIVAYCWPSRFDATDEPTSGDVDTNVTAFPFLSRSEHTPYQGRPSSAVKGYMTSKKLWGLPRLDTGHISAELAAQTTGALTFVPNRPGAQWDWKILVHNHSPVGSTTGRPPIYVRAQVYVTYYVEFYDRRNGPWRGIIPDGTPP